MKTSSSQICWFCDHAIDPNEGSVRVPTLESVLHGKPEAHAHELCAAQAYNEHIEDKAAEMAFEDMFIETRESYTFIFGEEL